MRFCFEEEEYVLIRSGRLNFRFYLLSLSFEKKRTTRSLTLFQSLVPGQICIVPDNLTRAFVRWISFGNFSVTVSQRRQQWRVESYEGEEEVRGASKVENMDYARARTAPHYVLAAFSNAARRQT